ncbi:MAG: hypothetical protein IJV77_05050 [Clostridia bacterium]|nr:hypothetical protein [Clostridia bacterium]
MKQAIWCGKEIRKEQSDGILELALFSYKHLPSFVYTVFTRERLPDGRAYAIATIRSIASLLCLANTKTKRQKKKPKFSLGFISWRGKEIRKEQSDRTARTKWSVTPVPCPRQNQKAKEKAQFSLCFILGAP